MDEKQLLASRVKALRERSGWTIAETARRAGLSSSMLWKVENGQTTLTYGKLMQLASGFGVPVGELFSRPEPAAAHGGRRVVDRAGSSPFVNWTDNIHHFLATEIAEKAYFPMLIEVNAVSDGSDAEAHDGEEFAYVIDGEIRLFCDGYAPVVLKTGDSVYFDASLRHRYTAVDGKPSRVLCVYSHGRMSNGGKPDEGMRHSRAMQIFDGDIVSDGEVN